MMGRRSLADFGEGTSRWLTAVLPGLAAGPVLLRLRGLLLTDLCVRLMIKTSEEAAQVESQLTNQLEGATEHELWEAEPETVLLATLVLRRLGRSHTGFRSYAQTVLSALQDSEDVPEHFATRFLLHRLGELPALAPAAARGPIDFGRVLHGNRTAVLELARRVDTLTAMGTRHSAAPSELVVALRCLALVAAKRYDLHVACALFRALLYLGDHPSLATTTLLEFVADQWHPKGYFGFVEPEVEAARQGEPCFDPLTYQIPTTLACLWTLAESVGEEYRLYRDLGDSRQPKRGC